MTAARGEPAPTNAAPYLQLLFREPADGKPTYHRLTDTVAMVPFEFHKPIRRFPAYHGKRAHEASYWFTRTGRHVRCESRFELTAVMLLDFSGEVVNIASNPFWILWPPGHDPQRHVPDFFARLGDGRALVVDVHPEKLIRADTARRHDLTRALCSDLGWHYHVFTQVAPTLERNITVLNGYGHQRFCPPAQLREQLLDRTGPPALQLPLPLEDLVGAVARDTDRSRAVVIAAVFHLLWQHQLFVDLREPLSLSSTVWR